MTPAPTSPSPHEGEPVECLTQAPDNDCSIADLVGDAVAALHRCDPESARPLVETALSAALSQARAPLTHVLRLYDLVFELHAANLVREARDVTRRLGRWIDSSPDAATLQETIGQERELAGEMAQLPLRFDAEVRRVIAQSLLSRSLEAACEECWLISAEARLVSVESADDLIARAPKLAARLVPFLDPHADLADLQDAENVQELGMLPTRRLFRRTSLVPALAG